MNSIFVRRLFISRAQRVLSAAVLAVAANACDESPVEVVNRDVTVALSVSANAFRRSEGTIVRVTITNNGRETISLPPEECQTPFEVLRNNRTIVATRNNSCIQIYAPQIIQPGQSVINQQRWNGLDWHSAVELTSGEYALRGKVFDGDQPVVSSPVSVEILSN